MTGERILPTPQADREAQGQPSDLPHFPWFLVVYVEGLIVAGLFVWIMGRPPSRKASEATPAGQHVSRLTWGGVGEKHQN